MRNGKALISRREAVRGLREYRRRNPLAHGGELRNLRRGRGARPLCTRRTMHFVLRSTRAVGPRSFKIPENERKVRAVLEKFTEKNGIRLLRLVNVGNHLHLHLQLGGAKGYRPFIRGVTSALAYVLVGRAKGFWDKRPFSRVIHGGERALRVLDRYLRVNVLQSLGYSRDDARFFAEKGYG